MSRFHASSVAHFHSPPLSLSLSIWLLVLSVLLLFSYVVIFHDDDDEHEEHSSLSDWFDCSDRGPQIRTVASSDADANIDGYTGFQDTQLTGLVWPTNLANGSSRLICQM